MESSASNNYLLTAVRTAPPQKLHLMLIEGALRFCGRARQQRAAGQFDIAVDSLLRAQEIVTQLMVNLDTSNEAAQRLASVYLFLFDTLGAACRDRDDKPIDDAVRVLEVERETWQLVCQRLTSETPAPARQVPPPLGGKLAADRSRAGFSADA